MIETDFVPEEWMLREADARGVLGVAAEWVAFSREADRLRVRSALRWAELHPASGADAACWGLLDGGDCEVPVNREGCPGVLSSSVAELAAAMQMTTAAGLYLLDACLELRFRLPLLYRRFEDLEVDFAKVRFVTRLTEKLGPDAAAYVDAKVAPILHRVGRRKVEEVVATAIVRFHPELVEERARAGKARWHVSVQHPDMVDFASTSELDAAADSLDLEDFMSALSLVAEDLARDGDSDTREQRLAKSLGIIGRAMTGRPEHPSADQRPEPEPDTESDPEPDTEPDAGPEPDTGLVPTPADAPAETAAADAPVAGRASERVPVPRSPQRRRRAGIVVRAQLHVDAVTGASSAVYLLPGLGAVAEEVFERWVETHGATVTRVVDLNRRWAVDQHDPPPGMREQVQERDRHCVFPGCEVPAESCDLDHIVPYRDDGPPGQTCPEGLACLCRMHHLFKTHHGWRYGRLSDGTYLWVSPTGKTYLVNRDGTTWVTDQAA